MDGCPMAELAAHAKDLTGEVDAREHLADAERRLTWTRRVGVWGWAFLLYWREGSVRLDWVWAVYVAGLIYSSALHWYVRRRPATRITAWFATICDSCLVYFMCLVNGGPASPILPFFYFVTLAGSFRFGVEALPRVLLLNGGLLVALFLASPHTPPSGLLLALFNLGFAAALGTMLAGWARANLDIANARTEALIVERDRSNTLLRRLISAEEDERKRLAEDLHDRMGARLFYLKHALDQLRALGALAGPMSPEFNTMQEQVDSCGADVRSLMNELRPTVLDDLGLYEALSEYFSSLDGICPFTIEANLDARLRGWSSKQDDMLFRLVQEALFNVRKHARATRVRVALESVGGQIVLSLKDNGCGFDPAQVPSGRLGLQMARERAKAAGGVLEIDSAPGKGATLRVVL
jgi:two-component system NarL family sensor kinase